MPMLLIGRTLSPFVRRVAATLNLYGLPFENRPYSTIDDTARIAEHNPLVRVPALVLEDGSTLIDSSAILDFLDQQAGPIRALTPLAGPERRAVMAVLGLALGVCEKTVAGVYEKRRPAALQWPENLDRLCGQVRGGLAALEAGLAGEWLVLGRMTQADVTATIALDAVEAMLREVDTTAFPRLSALRDRVDAIPAVGSTRFKA